VGSSPSLPSLAQTSSCATGWGGGQQKKDQKLAKKAKKIALLSLYISIMFVPCMKIQGGHDPPADARECT